MIAYILLAYYFYSIGEKTLGHMFFALCVAKAFLSYIEYVNKHYHKDKESD